MANIPGIVVEGPDWFRSVGTEKSPGTIVCTVTGATRRHGVGEFPMGTPLREVIETIGGGPRSGQRVRAVLSGVANALLPGNLLDTPVTYEDLKEAGSGLGSAGFIVFDESNDPVAVAAGVSRFLAVESCGQCTPCKQEGLSIAGLLERVGRDQADATDLDALRASLATVTDSARCFLATQHQVVVESMLRLFPDNVRAHLDQTAEAVVPELIVPIVELDGDAARLDEDHATKQPDWTHDERVLRPVPRRQGRRHRAHVVTPGPARLTVPRRHRGEQTLANIDGAAVDGLRAQASGTVSLPGEPGYDAAVRIWNGAIARRPAIVVSCATSADVAAALTFARNQGLEVSVRGGGHSYAGYALCDGGLMVDLTPMKAVTVDPGTRRARCGGGTTWGGLDGATQAHALALPGGFISHTGVGGLTLGGGLGWLSRLAGLTADNLVGAEVVTADGRVVHASADENAELLWALRGGGGNFGVVTEFEFALHPVGPFVHVGLFLFGADQGAEVLRFARDFMPGLPDECGGFIAGLSTPPAPFVPPELHFTPAFALAVVGFGDAEAHAALIAPITAALTPTVALVTPMPYVALQQMFDESAPWGLPAYEKAVSLEELTDGAIDVILEHFARKMSPLSFMPIFVLGGAYGRADEDAAAFGGSRAIRYVVNISGVTPSPAPADFDAERSWVRDFWSALVPHAVGIGSYVNFMVEYEEDRVRAAYGPKYARLQAVKAEYDPDNVFHLNANIRPAS